MQSDESSGRKKGKKNNKKNKHCCYGTCKSDTRRCLHLLSAGIKVIPFQKNRHDSRWYDRTRKGKK